MVIYKITNLINGKKYIGQTKDFKKRMYSHKNNHKRVSNHPLYSDMVTYGLDNFTFEIIDTAETVEDLDRLETYYILKEDSTIDGNGYNISLGNNQPLTESARLAMIERQTGENNWMFGKPSQFRERVLCVDTGEIFESVTDASEKLNLILSKIAAVCRGTRGTTGGLRFKYLDREVEPSNFKNHTRKLFEKNTSQTFNSLITAVDILNLSYDSVNHMFRKYGYYYKDTVYLVDFEDKDKEFDIEFDLKRLGKPIKNIELNKIYPSIRSACVDIDDENYRNLATKLRKHNGECKYKGYTFKFI